MKATKLRRTVDSVTMYGDTMEDYFDPDVGMIGDMPRAAQDQIYVRGADPDGGWEIADWVGA